MGKLILTFLVFFIIIVGSLVLSRWKNRK